MGKRIRANDRPLVMRNRSDKHVAPKQYLKLGILRPVNGRLVPPGGTPSRFTLDPALPIHTSKHSWSSYFRKMSIIEARKLLMRFPLIEVLGASSLSI